ncbi:MAG: hypothetical protein DRI95_05565 [Bacteroidetes bacterium]|nr:MAG: hypothetical protein DRI95_05565 [Bacteroidota bacterium]
MKKHAILLTLLITFLLSNFSYGQWRGPKHDGIYPEKNLLKLWPENGPELLWVYEGIGDGYGSPEITDERIYINGEIDSMGYLFAFDLQGKLLWKSENGKVYTQSFPGSRSTPTVVNNLIYTASGRGQIVCFESETGKEKWSVNMIKDLQGQNNRFGLSETILVDDDKLFCTPGGKDTNVVAIDPQTGIIKWVCKGLGQIPAYNSPIIIKLEKRKILVTFTRRALLGIDAVNGELLWSHEQDTSRGESLFDVHCNSPIYENGYIYYVTGDGNGAVKLKLSEDGSTITEIWRNLKFDDVMGGFVKVNNRLIASSWTKRRWNMLDTNSGEIIDSLKIGKGSTIFADDMLYLYTEKGKMVLVKAHTDSLQVISTFKIKKGTKQHFSHPVINKGILYVRRGNALMAYAIKNEE